MKMRRASCLTGFVAGLSLLLAPTLSHGKDVKPEPALAGHWTLIGTTHAGRSPDHDALIIKGVFNAYSQLKFMVSDSALYMQRMVVTFEHAAPYRITLLQNIPPGGESRPVDLPGDGPRNVLKVEYWYQTVGPGQGQAAVSVFGMR